MKPSLVALTLFSLSVLGCGNSETAEDRTNQNAPAQTIGQANTSDHTAMSTGSMESRMQAMNAEMVQHLGPADAEYDHRFIDMMIPHHEGAIMMAKDALQKSQRPEIKKLAEEIITAQEKEIVQLKAWSEAWYHKH